MFGHDAATRGVERAAEVRRLQTMRISLPHLKIYGETIPVYVGGELRFESKSGQIQDDFWLDDEDSDLDI